VEHRSCRDVLFLLFFAAYLGGMFVVAGIAFQNGACGALRPRPGAAGAHGGRVAGARNAQRAWRSRRQAAPAAPHRHPCPPPWAPAGDARRLVYALDSRGMLCGTTNTYRNETLDLTDKPNLYYLNVGGMGGRMAAARMAAAGGRMAAPWRVHACMAWPRRAWAGPTAAPAPRIALRRWSCWMPTRSRSPSQSASPSAPATSTAATSTGCPAPRGRSTGPTPARPPARPPARSAAAFACPHTVLWLQHA
jgi:hypothetical protein